MRCQGCGTENRDEAIFCAACGLGLSDSAAAAQPTESTSGFGPSSPVPEGLRRWNWGAFYLSLFWTAAHNLWGWFAAFLLVAVVPSVLLGIFALLWLPYMCLALLLIMIYLGVHGNELAWGARPFDSVEHFFQVQRAWKIAALVCFIVFTVLPVIGIGVAAVSVPAYFHSMTRRINQARPAPFARIRPEEPARPPFGPSRATPGSRLQPSTTGRAQRDVAERESDRQAVQHVLRSLESALARGDSRAFLNLVDPAEADLRARTSADLSAWFANGRGVKASYQEDSVEVNGDRAVVKGAYAAQWTEENSPREYRSRFEMHLRKREDNWLETGWQEWPIEPLQQARLGGSGTDQSAGGSRAEEDAERTASAAVTVTPGPDVTQPTSRVGARTRARQGRAPLRAGSPEPVPEDLAQTRVPRGGGMRSGMRGDSMRSGTRSGMRSGMRGTRRGAQVEAATPTPGSDASSTDQAPVVSAPAIPEPPPKPRAVVCLEGMMEELGLANSGVRVSQPETAVPLVHVSFSSDMPYSTMRRTVILMVTKAVKELEADQLCIIADVRGRSKMRAEYRPVSEKVVITDLR